MTGDDRGQIQFDFAVGVSILVMTIVVAFTFVPGLFGGVTDGRVQGDQVAADRVAAWLAEDGLDDPSMPGRVNTNCTVALFGHSADADGCEFDKSSATANVEENFDLLDRNVNVTIQQDGKYVYWSDSDDEFNTTASGKRLADSGTPGGRVTVSVATRPVSIDGYAATIVVRVW